MLSFGAVSSDVDYVYWTDAVPDFVLGNVVGLYRNEGDCSGDLKTCFEDWIGTMCIEA